jgi:UDP-glucuronate 4-epimerase
VTFELPSSLRRFLVTGGAGFIGSHVVDRLLAAGVDQVVAVDDFNDFYDPRIKWGNIGAHLAHPAYRLVIADIRDAARLERLRGEDFDCVIHLAARAGVGPSLPEARLYQEVNVGGTLNLLELARAAGWRHFLFASSSSVYGALAQPPFREDAPLRPISPYAATKCAGELLAHTYSHLYGLRVVCLRFFTVYGARQRPDLAIHKFARAILDGRPIPFYGDGSSERDYTYLDDILQGIAGAMRYTAEGETPFEIVNLGESRRVSLEQLVGLLEQALGERAILDRRSAQDGDVPLTQADIGKAQRLFGYAPATPIEAGIERFAEWLRLTRSETRAAAAVGKIA